MHTAVSTVRARSRSNTFDAKSFTLKQSRREGKGKGRKTLTRKIGRIHTLQYVLRESKSQIRLDLVLCIAMDTSRVVCIRSMDNYTL